MGYFKTYAATFVQLKNLFVQIFAIDIIEGTLYKLSGYFFIFEEVVNFRKREQKKC